MCNAPGASLGAPLATESPGFRRDGSRWFRAPLRQADRVVNVLYTVLNTAGRAGRTWGRRKTLGAGGIVRALSIVEQTVSSADHLRNVGGLECITFEPYPHQPEEHLDSSR
ncbi:hypothetical protein GCM10027563_44420 [Parasphingorhabdus pacifica]